MTFQSWSQTDVAQNAAPSAQMEQGHKEIKAIQHTVRLLLQKSRGTEGPTMAAEAFENIPTEDVRAVAICLTLTLGVFGAHRIYLGTKDYVPVFYTLTLGGGLGILPVIDLIHLCVKKDISSYYQNDRLIMWGGN